MYILGNDVAAQSLCTSISDIFDIEGFVVFKNDRLYLLKDNETKLFEHLVGNTYALATLNRTQRAEFIKYFSSLPGVVLPDLFPNLFFERSYISNIAKLGCGNIFYPNSGLYGTASIGSFNYFFPYSSAQLGSTMGNNNFMHSYSCLDNESSLEDNNSLMTSSIVTPNITVGSQNLLHSGEVLYENMENSQYFQSGIVMSK